MTLDNEVSLYSVLRAFITGCLLDNGYCVHIGLRYGYPIWVLDNQWPLSLENSRIV